jgi:hypothetical protein
MKIAQATKRKFRQSPLAWRFALNSRSTLSYLLIKNEFSPEGQRVLRDLNKDGIALSTIGALLGNERILDELGSEVEALEKKFGKQMDAARAQASDSNAIGEKKFIYFLLGDKPEINPSSVFARFAIQQPILGIANAYMGMHCQLRYYNVWHTFANTGPARESQLWHRDRDDYLTCKVFLYLNDVDEGAGPFTYARGTHPKGHNHAEPPFTMEGTVKRSDDAQMAQVAPRETWLKATGKKGTIIFADTRGYHKGGEARTSDRLMYTCMFLSPASDVREMMSVPSSLKLPENRAAALALARYAA